MRISDWSSDVCSADLMVVQQSAEEQIASLDNHSVQIFAGEGWHPGVIGIVAGRLKEKTGKPAFVIALERETGRSEDRRVGKGGVSTGRHGWSPYTYKTTNDKQTFKENTKKRHH